MVFGGVVHERLQLNEDTLWAGRPYDPVNPDAKAAAAGGASPDHRKALCRRRCPGGQERDGEAAGADAYRTLGDLGLTFAPVDVVERYRRDLDLSTATAHVSYTAGGVTFDREVFASAPDQVIVVQLTASRPGQISFEARLHTPQRATTEATADGDLVMRGVNGDGRGATADGRPMTGALRFESRVRVLDDRRNPHRCRRRRRRARRRRGDAAHRGGDELPALRRRQRRPGCVSGRRAEWRVGKTVDALRAAHVRDYRKLFDRVTLDLGQSTRAALPTDERVRRIRRRRRSRRSPRCTSSTPLPADRQLAARPQPANLQGIWNDSIRRRGAASTRSTSTPR